jgi:hypothetical protein
MNRRANLMRGLCALLLIGACGDDVIEDPSFDKWCGGSLCDWDTDAGSIQRVPTWNERDHAVALLGDSTQLSQHADTDASCLNFHMVANVDADSDTSVAVDFNDDGSIDFERTVPVSAWQRVQFSISAPVRYHGVRFLIRKAKPGKAMFAQLRAERASDCTGPRVTLHDLPSGAPCGEHAECASHVCGVDGCAECANDSMCSTDQLCVAGYCTRCAVDTDCGAGERCTWSGVQTSEGRRCVAEDTPISRGSLALCDRDADCKNARCEVSDWQGLSRCGVGCSSDAECGVDQVCRVFLAPGLTLIAVCAAPAGRGEFCERAQDCGTNRCCHGLCARQDSACE